MHFRVSRGCHSPGVARTSLPPVSSREARAGHTEVTQVPARTQAQKCWPLSPGGPATQHPLPTPQVCTSTCTHTHTHSHTPTHALTHPATVTHHRTDSGPKLIGSCPRSARHSPWPGGLDADLRTGAQPLSAAWTVGYKSPGAPGTQRHPLPRGEPPPSSFSPLPPLFTSQSP